MLRTTCLAAAGLALIASTAGAQIAITTAPPTQSPQQPVQEGAVVRVGQGPSGALGAQVVGGQQLPIGTVTVAPQGDQPTGNGVQAYVRVPREGGQPSGNPTGLDARVNVGDIYRGVQVGKQ